VPHFLVTTELGPDWDHARPRRDQDDWEHHAAFMDALVEEGLIVLGGPLGDPDHDEHTALLFAAGSEREIRARMAEDPWSGRLLRIAEVQPWTLWLGGD
jgi:uncharacterized protein YciI